jgi:hypothetical protein
MTATFGYGDENELWHQGDPRGTYGRYTPPESPQEEDST